MFNKCYKKGNEAGPTTKIGGGPQSDRATMKTGMVRGENRGESPEERRRHRKGTEPGHLGHLRNWRAWREVFVC